MRFSPNRLSHFQHACMCVNMCVCVSSGSPLGCVSHVCVLYTQHCVVVGAGAGVLSQQTTRLQQRRLARHRHVARPPRLAVVGGQAGAHLAGAVPHQLLRPAGGQKGEERRRSSVRTVSFWNAHPLKFSSAGLLTTFERIIFTVEFLKNLYFSEETKNNSPLAQRQKRSPYSLVFSY